jgi:hypothetical protein
LKHQRFPERGEIPLRVDWSLCALVEFSEAVLIVEYVTAEMVIRQVPGHGDRRPEGLVLQICCRVPVERAEAVDICLAEVTHVDLDQVADTAS